jgi:hypothetical protein
MKINIEVNFDEKNVIDKVSKHIINNLKEVGKPGFFEGVAQVAVEAVKETMDIKIDNKKLNIIGDN